MQPKYSADVRENYRPKYSEGIGGIDSYAPFQPFEYSQHEREDLIKK